MRYLPNYFNSINNTKQPLIIKLTFYRRFRTKKSDLNTSNNTLLSCKPLIIGSNDKRILETIY